MILARYSFRAMGSPCALTVYGRKFDVDWRLHLPTGGTINRVFHWTVNADCWLSDDVALRLGFALDPGPQGDRSYNYALQVGATWRPGSDRSAG